VSEISQDDRPLPDEDFTTPERLLHLSDDELIGEAARFGRTLAKLDEVQLLGIGWVLIGGLAAVFAILFARQGLKMIRGDDSPFRRHHG